ncbi:MAG: hypothetical protein WCS92_01580 [Candidatus Babeliales bacterium]
MPVLYKEFIKKNSRKIISLFILGVVFLVFVLMNPQWYFDGEDYVQLFRCYKVKSIKDFLDFFIHGSLDTYRSLLHPFEIWRQTFFSVYYRPMCLVLYFFEYSLFGLNAYMHFMFLMFFHSLNTSILCYFIIPFTGNFFAILFSLFYAFHPSFCFIGKWDCQQHIFTTFFAILAAVFLIKKIRNIHSKTMLPLASYLFFFLSLGVRETFIVFPLMAIFIMNLYERSQYYKFQRILDQLKIVIGFGLTILVYFFMRQISYSIVFSSVGLGNYFSVNILSMNTIHVLYLYLLSCFHPLYSVYYIFDQHKFLWLYRFIKIFTLSIPFILFFTSTKKKLILLLAFFTALLFWPIFICGYGGQNDRTFYEASISFILMFIALFKFTWLRKYHLAKYCGAVVLAFMIAYNLFFLNMQRQRAFKHLQSTFYPILELKTSVGKALQDTPFFIFSLPFTMYHWMSLPQAIELYGISRVAIDCYCDSRIRIHSFMPIKDNLIIRTGANSFRFITTDKDKLWFSYDKPFCNIVFDDQHNYDDFPYGRHNIYIHSEDNSIIVPFQSNKIYDISVIFKDAEYFHHDAKFLTWDYESSKFVVLNSAT